MPHLGILRAANPIAFFMAENTKILSDNRGNTLIKQYIISNYRPAKDYASANAKLSTLQLYRKVTKMFPDATISISEFHNFMIDQGYTDKEIRPFETEWILNKKI